MIAAVWLWLGPFGKSIVIRAEEIGAKDVSDEDGHKIVLATI